MDTRDLIEKLIEAIDGIAQEAANRGHIDIPGWLMNRLEDAEETAELAKMVLPTINTAPPAPTPIVGFFAADVDYDLACGPYPTEAEAMAVVNKIDVNSTGGSFQVTTEAVVLAAATGGGACTCGAPIDANGCTDPNCPDGNHPSNPAIPAQTFKDVMDDLHNTVQERHRPGSGISAKPPGSLYQN